MDNLTFNLNNYKMILKSENLISLQKFRFSFSLNFSFRFFSFLGDFFLARLSLGSW